MMHLLINQIKKVYWGHEKANEIKWRKAVDYDEHTGGRVSRKMFSQNRCSAITEEKEIRTWAIYKGWQCFVLEIMIMSWKSLCAQNLNH